ncbi:hypothetical protein VTJ04DRAFT_6146 [Mycothermus thermophilus]|uniref:uncharacterized protein n=1 Tax=Humicola insolens TaxID=85995 RepID=UPI0037444806
MAPPSAQAHKRAHSLLLLDKLLSLRDSASPLTVVLDTLEQSARPVLGEFMRRAKAERAKLVYVSYATVKKPALADAFVKARGKGLDVLVREVAGHVEMVSSSTTQAGQGQSQSQSQKSLILIDTLNPLLLTHPHLLPAFFSAILPHPSVSLVAVYHLDIPSTISSPSSTIAGGGGVYTPDPLALLTHLATAVLRVSSLRHEIEAKKARERSLPEPEWGLREGREGCWLGLKRGGEEEEEEERKKGWWWRWR